MVMLATSSDNSPVWTICGLACKFIVTLKSHMNRSHKN